MTKDELIFSVKGIIEGQASTQDGLKYVHPQEIEIEIAKAYESAMIQFFETPEMSENYDLDYFSKTYTETLKETSGGELYVDLPATPISVKGGVGIRIVKPKDSNVSIERISESRFMNLRHLEAFCCSPVPFCYSDISGKKIVLQINRPEYRIMDKITIKLIPKFDEFEDDDDINSPGGDYSITQRIMQEMGLRPTDNTNDDAK
jgi:hypothetical protein